MAKDSLAAGARSAVFGPPAVSQEEWDRIFGPANTDTDTEPEYRVIEVSFDGRPHEVYVGSRGRRGRRGWGVGPGSKDGTKAEPGSVVRSTITGP